MTKIYKQTKPGYIFKDNPSFYVYSCFSSPDCKWTILNFPNSIEVLSNIKGQQLCSYWLNTIEANRNKINFAPIAKKTFIQQKINEYEVIANSKHKLPQKFQFFESKVRIIGFKVDRKQNFNIVAKNTLY